MGYVYSQCVNLGLDMESNIVKAEEYAENALQLDPESSEAHLVIGFLSQVLGGNERKTIQHLRQALSLNPGDTHAKLWLGLSLCNTGKMDEARIIWDDMGQMDPLTPMSRVGPGIIGLYEGRVKQAAEGVFEWFRLEAQNPAAVYFYALTLVYAGRLKEASEIIDQHVNTEGPDTFTKNSLLIKYAIERDTQKIKELVTGDYNKNLRSDSQDGYFASVLYVIAGMKNAALDLLETAVDNGFINYPLMSEKDPILEGIRGEARFKKLMKRVKHEWENFDA
jgi:Tfp pilus assembly protein PilF